MENKTDLIERLRKIANELENECKPEFEVGKWYKDVDSKCLHFVVKFNGMNSEGKNYGFDYDGNWMELESREFDKIHSLATESEVLEALTKEAVKRGLVKGCTIASSNGKIYLNNNNGYGISSSNSNVFLLCNYPIMEYGTWASVIKDLSLEEWYNVYIIDSSIPPAMCDYIKQTKTELIEILNNLPND